MADGALAAPDITLKSAVARSSAGQDLGAALGREAIGVPVFGEVAEALPGSCSRCGAPVATWAWCAASTAYFSAPPERPGRRPTLTDRRPHLSVP